MQNPFWTPWDQVFTKLTTAEECSCFDALVIDTKKDVLKEMAVISAHCY